MMIAGDLAALTFGAARARPATALVRMKSRRFIFFMGSSNYLESARRGATCELMRKRRNSITRSDKWQRLALDIWTCGRTIFGEGYSTAFSESAGKGRVCEPGSRAARVNLTDHERS